MSSFLIFIIPNHFFYSLSLGYQQLLLIQYAPTSLTTDFCFLPSARLLLLWQLMSVIRQTFSSLSANLNQVPEIQFHDHKGSMLCNCLPQSVFHLHSNLFSFLIQTCRWHWLLFSSSILFGPLYCIHFKYAIFPFSPQILHLSDSADWSILYLM